MPVESKTRAIERLTLGQIAQREAMTSGMVRKRLAAWGLRADKDGRYDFGAFRARRKAGQFMKDAEAAPARADAHTRKLEAETKLLEMKIAEREGVLVEAEAMTAAVCKQITAAKNDLMAIGRRVAPECVGGTAGQIEAAINRAVRDALRHVSEYSPE